MLVYLPVPSSFTFWLGPSYGQNRPYHILLRFNTAVIWPKYCRYGVKPHIINPSINQSIILRFQNLNSIMLWSNSIPNSVNNSILRKSLKIKYPNKEHHCILSLFPLHQRIIPHCKILDSLNLAVICDTIITFRIPMVTVTLYCLHAPTCENFVSYLIKSDLSFWKCKGYDNE